MVKNSQIIVARRAIVNRVLDIFSIDTLPGDNLPLDDYLQHLPTTNINIRQPVAQILTLLGSEASPAVQASGIISNPADYIRREQTLPNAAPELENARSVLDDVGADHIFERWLHLIQRATLNITSGEAGVSVYQHIKLLSAIVHATGGDPNRLSDGFTLVSGDFPGVQKAIYTINSQGATKGVRGRSFFLQLLTECVVRRLLAAAENLPSSNIIYIAGSKFLLLLPASSEAVVDTITGEINSQLLEVFQGDYRLVTAAEPLAAEHLTGSIADEFKQLKQRETRRKYRPFLDVVQSAEAGWEKVFGTQPAAINLPGSDGLTQVRCEISHREAMQHEADEAKEALDQQDYWVAPEQRAFAGLASDLAKKADPCLVFSQQRPQKTAHYTGYLHQITGWACQIVPAAEVEHTEVESTLVLRLNQIDFDYQRFDGFRLLAVHTPVMTGEDIEYLRDAGLLTGEQYLDGEPEAGDIRDFHAMAGRRSPGLKRLGYLRMDIDSLGQIFGQTLAEDTLTRRMAASDALSYFFDGYVAQLCQEFEADDTDQRPNSLYLIYGGGDDLFIVGEWQRTPEIAQRIRKEFQAFTNNNLTISAGISLLGEKFPFYRGAELTGKALDETAKRDEKNAVAFLGERIRWDEWLDVYNLQEKLVWLAETMQQHTVANNVLRIYNQWASDQRRGRNQLGDKDLYYGPYLWQAAYQLTRVADKHKDQENDIRDIQKKILEHKTTMRLIGVAARWASFILRASKNSR